MITRPWVVPQEVRNYSDYADVGQRADVKLAFDIARAEQNVISVTNNKFNDEELTALPGPVRQAVILVAERYAHNAHLSSQKYKSETLDDWSYTVNEPANSLDDLGLGMLLDEYVLDAVDGDVTMRLRKL
ncbi:MAG: DUF3199 family protein [Alphaproteobacteria bacterium]|nr:DUF3199 family protein [Alphaproteobacteria bacterium]